jgi:hypothetical protein
MRSCSFSGPPLRRFEFVAPGFFQTMGTRLIAGRDLTWTDIYDQRRVAVISENITSDSYRQSKLKWRIERQDRVYPQPILFACVQGNRRSEVDLIVVDGKAVSTSKDKIVRIPEVRQEINHCLMGIHWVSAHNIWRIEELTRRSVEIAIELNNELKHLGRLRRPFGTSIIIGSFPWQTRNRSRFRAA